MAVFIVIGAAIGASNLYRLSELMPLTIVDIALAYVPLLLLAAGVAGMWFMRWWALALPWLLVALATVGSLFVPFPGPSEGFVPYLVMNAAILIAVIALPPTLIAVI